MRRFVMIHELFNNGAEHMGTDTPEPAYAALGISPQVLRERQRRFSVICNRHRKNIKTITFLFYNRSLYCLEPG